MKVIFYQGKGDLGDKLIRWKTASWKQRLNGSWKELPSHCELLFDDGMMFSASQYENTTRFVRHNQHSDKWDRVTLQASKEQVDEMLKFCNKQEGKKYDYLGVVGFVLPFVSDSKDKWFCSEVVAEALDRVGIISVADSARVSPAKLKQVLSDAMI